LVPAGWRLAGAKTNISEKCWFLLAGGWQAQKPTSLKDVGSCWLAAGRCKN